MTDDIWDHREQIMQGADRLARIAELAFLTDSLERALKAEDYGLATKLARKIVDHDSATDAVKTHIRAIQEGLKHVS